MEFNTAEKYQIDSKNINESIITVDEMSKRLQIARATAYQLVKTDDFPCFYIGKRIIIPLHLFNAWLEKQANEKTTILEVE